LSAYTRTMCIPHVIMTDLVLLLSENQLMFCRLTNCILFKYTFTMLNRQTKSKNAIVFCPLTNCSTHINTAGFWQRIASIHLYSRSDKIMNLNLVRFIVKIHKNATFYGAIEHTHFLCLKLSFLLSRFRSLTAFESTGWVSWKPYDSTASVVNTLPPKGSTHRFCKRYRIVI
jgi:hypothetical protein